MTRSRRRIAASMLVLLLTLSPLPGQALAPVLLLLVKQIVKDAAQSMLKDMLLSSLNGMGCKGMAIANALQALDLRKGAGGGGMMGMFGGAMPKLPSGGAMPGLPAGMAMPQMPGGMTMPQMPAGMSIPGMPAMPGGMAGMTGMGLGAPGSEEMMARMRAMMPGGGQMPAGTGIDPEQMSRIMQAMSQPLSPPETLAVIDEMTEIGFLPKAMQAELKECMVLIPTAAPALGMGMGMLKPMLPQLRQAREQLHALSPAEQDELVAALAPEMKALPADERKNLLEFLDSGFFPKRVAEGLRRQLG
ncbi:MAG: hypothetical protein K8R60_08560 [Burkholderiales bacterium]|nr:hypothetical protein [Burkholderiales bacterium]